MAKGGFQGGRGMPGGMSMNRNMLRQAQKMQQDMMKMQQEVEEREYSASAGGGMVTATVNGKRELLKLAIDPDAVIDAGSEEDVEMLSDAILAAVNEALNKAGDDMSSAMGRLTGGLNLNF